MRTNIKAGSRHGIGGSGPSMQYTSQNVMAHNNLQLTTKKLTKINTKKTSKKTENKNKMKEKKMCGRHKDRLT